MKKISDIIKMKSFKNRKRLERKLRKAKQRRKDFKKKLNVNTNRSEDSLKKGLAQPYPVSKKYTPPKKINEK